MRSSFLLILCLFLRHGFCTQNGTADLQQQDVQYCPAQTVSTDSPQAEVSILRVTKRDRHYSLNNVSASQEQPDEFHVLQCQSGVPFQHTSSSSASSSQSVQGCNSQNGSWAYSNVSGRLIVRFWTYKTAESHKADLAACLAGVGNVWKWVDRQNAAASHPTDFGLLEVADTDTDKIKVSVTWYWASTTKQLVILFKGIVFCFTEL